ncbi:S-layer homology domain-containing protein [Paenibacillus cymbidii]|uniref:S-layer homology domain-containing protein n=1 Tax=Paenibacillus cymbidii TaxID=1639034 RepID=UPI00143695E0|nr:S-layer homology domain-containing protein [Paenibacillus cymbidii]
MKKKSKSWLSMTIVTTMLATMLLSALAPLTAMADVSRITIKPPWWTAFDISSGRPAPTEDASIPRVTSARITVEATIQNISDVQVPNMYYEITNVTTGAAPVVENKNHAYHQPGSFDITFNNVQLTEGLNKIVVKLGDTNSIASSPAWVYFTPTTTISDLTINDQPFLDGKFFPDVPSSSTAISIKGKAPNASEVQVNVMGDAQTKNAFFSNGSFFFSADDANKAGSAATFRLKPGDNVISMTARNAQRSYQTTKRFVYDNGKPFAFNAKISDNDSSVADPVKYDLISSPTINSASGTGQVDISTSLKIDLNTSGQPKYRFVDAILNGQKLGSYDVGNADQALSVTAVNPTKLYSEYGKMLVSVVGSALHDAIVLAIKQGGSEITYLNPQISLDRRVALFDLPGGLIGNYAVEVRDENDKVLYSDLSRSVPVSNVNNGSYLDVEAPAIPVHEGDTAQVGDLSGIDTSGATPSVKVEITDLTGQVVIGNASVQIDAGTYTLPAGLREGEYKLRASVNNIPLSENYLQILDKIPAQPVITSKVPVNVSTLASGDYYFSVTGTSLPSNLDEIIELSLYSGNSYDNRNDELPIPIDPEYVELGPSSMTMRVESGERIQLFSDYDPDNPTVKSRDWKLHLVVRPKFKNGDDIGTDYTVTSPTAVVRAQYVDDTAPSTPVEFINNMYPITTDSTNPRQIATGSASQVRVEGTNLPTDKTQLVAQMLSETGGAVSGVVSVIDAPDGSTATISIPSLNAGNYFITLRDKANPYALASFPISVVGPKMTKIAPNYVDMNMTGTIAVTGAGFGKSSYVLDNYKLRFRPEGDPTAPSVDLGGGSMNASGQLLFPFTSNFLANGTYDVSIVYAGNEVQGTPQKFTVTTPSILRENPTLSRVNRYKVYDFQKSLPVSTNDRNQILEFRFYNSAIDTAPSTKFNFTYIDTIQPYVDHVHYKDPLTGMTLSGTADSEIDEQPAKLYVMANINTSDVKMYIGDSQVGIDSLGGASTQIDSETNETFNMFEFDLPTLPNGRTQVTFIPSDGSAENYSGRRSYMLNINNTPYIILNNVYNGMIVREDIPTLEGRFVNMPPLSPLPLDPADMAGKNYVQLVTSDNPTEYIEANSDSTFNHALLPLHEGRNQLKLMIYINNQLTTSTTIEIFKFSTDAPEILNMKPVELTDVPKYVPQKLPDNYATSERNVILTGQFANATEVKLTVKRKNESNPNTWETLYDRRYGSSFSELDPISDNPAFIDSIDPTTLQFTTSPIMLSKTGATTFELAITNSSNVTVTKTVTINREPLAYEIVYPTLAKNGKGLDQATINGNFVEIEMKSENADKITFGKNEAIKRIVTDPETGLQEVHYFYEMNDLKVGANNVKFTVTQGTQTINGEFVVFNSDTPIEGAQFKSALKSDIKAFDGMLNLKFPKGVNLMRNDSTRVNQFLTTDRKIVFGIASNADGRVDKIKHPSPTDGQVDNPNPVIGTEGALLLEEPTFRFRPASPLFWTDAGTIAADETDRTKALTGSGRDPYDTDEFYARSQQDLVVPSERGTLTLKYDPSIRTDAWKYLTVYHYDIFEDYKGVTQFRWKNIGGVIEPSSHTITVPFESFGYYQVMYMDQSFDDVTGHQWARDQLDTLYAKGYMLNKSNAAFEPEDPITRGEFATLLVKIFEIPLQYTETPTFTDVLRINPLTNGLYDYRYIETAAKVGVVRGMDGGRFAPDDAITRQDAAVMIARAANLKIGSDDIKALTSLQKTFTDANGIDIYARTSVEAVTKAGLIEGKDNVLLQGQKKPTVRFDPEENFSRAEAAEVAIRVLRQYKKIPK